MITKELTRVAPRHRSQTITGYKVIRREMLPGKVCVYCYCRNEASDDAALSAADTGNALSPSVEQQ